jgi:hypothetical protein
MKQRITGPLLLPKTNRNIPEPDITGSGHLTTPGAHKPHGWRPSLLGAAPLPIFIGLLAIFDIILPPAAQLGSALRFEPVYLNAILYTVFVSITSFLVAYISLKGYLQTGFSVLLLLGSASLALGSTSILGTWLANLPGQLNAGITIVNTGGLCASIFHLAGGSITSTRSSIENGPRIRKPLSITAYAGVLSFTTILSIASIDGLVPLFFVLGVGQTPLRMAVLGSSVALFAVSSVLFARLCLSSKSDTLYWYFLALGMTSMGTLAIFFGRAPGDPISWTGRAAQFLGGIYFLQAVLTAFRKPHPT